MNEWVGGDEKIDGDNCGSTGFHHKFDEMKRCTFITKIETKPKIRIRIIN